MREVAFFFTPENWSCYSVKTFIVWERRLGYPHKADQLNDCERCTSSDGGPVTIKRASLGRHDNGDSINRNDTAP